MKILNQHAPMSRRIQADFRGGSLDVLCGELLESQRKAWPQLEEAYDSLHGVRVRDLRCKGFFVRLQHNPGRMRSTLAGVDGKAMGERSCFLCHQNLPEAQKAILYHDEYLILCNPMPLFPLHLTISHVDHAPQAIADHMGTFIDLTADLGDRWMVLYNGPQCGASAPDHLHFQAVPSGHTPVEREIGEAKRLLTVSIRKGASLYCVSDLGREVAIIESVDPAALSEAFADYLNALKARLSLSPDEEPMLNIAGLYEEKRWRLLIFPRRKHRPRSFFMEGDARIVVSPAVIEMAGVLVTPFEKDFERLDSRDAEAIYREVSLSTGVNPSSAVVKYRINYYR
jgi:hypothetical protein